MKTLTKRQSEILKLIEDKVDNTGAPPTRAEIAKNMGFKSPNAAEDHLRALARKGIIELLPGTSRGIKLLNGNKPVPVIEQNKITQTKIQDPNNIKSYWRLDKSIFVQTIDFILQISDSDMKNAGIMPGDLLAVQISTTPPAVGQIVVMRINNTIKIRRLVKIDETLTLQADNPNIEHIALNLNNSQCIEGIGIGIIRTQWN